MRMHPGLHWYTVAKVLLYDAHIIYSADSSSGGLRGSPTQKQIRREFQDGDALVNAFPFSDMPSPAEVGQLYQYPYRSFIFLLGLIAYYVKEYYEPIEESQINKLLQALRLELPARTEGQSYDGYANVLSQLWAEIDVISELRPESQRFRSLYRHFIDAMRSSIDEKSYSVFDATLANHISKERTRLEAAADARPLMTAAIKSTVKELRERRWNESVTGVATGGGYRGPGQIQEPRRVCNNENGG